MARLAAVLLLLALGAPPAAAAVAARASEVAVAQNHANPIRKVVTMLQNMQMKVTEEGEKEKELYNKFMCYCKTSGGDLSTSIADAQAKIESMTSSIEEGKSKKSQTEADLKEHQTSRADAKEAMAAATALREKEAASFGKEKSESETNLAALAKAIKAIDKGVMGGFLQTSAANVVRQYAMEKADLPDTTRQELLAFLSGTQGEGYVPQSGEITGILKTMHDEMSKSLSDATAEENGAISNYESLMAAKKKEVATLQAQIEVEMTRIGDLGVSVAGAENDLEDTKEALTQDQQFNLELAKSCDTKTAEWEEIKKTRAEELLALAETIKVLNDDDALELFKKTLPSASASFVQVAVRSSAVRTRALGIIRQARSPQLDFIVLALTGKKIGFEKVITMIDEMVANLKKEQAADDDKRAYCESQFDGTEDKVKGLEQSISDSESAIKEMEGAIATVAEEMAALEAGIAALDKSVAEATENRKAENADYKELMASDSTAKEVLLFAKNRLNKFYNPKLHKAAPKRELSEEERITVNMGGTLAPTAPPGGIAGTGIGAAAALVQIRAHTQAKGAGAPPPPPETFGPYTKKGEESGGVVAMIDLLVKDLDKEMQEAEVSEKDSQAEYEKMMEESAAKRAADSKLLTEKSGLKATTEGELESEKDRKAATSNELMATAKYLKSLHAECDWLLQYFDARKAARSSEMEALTSAKAVLSGADYSLLQVRRGGFLAQRH